MFHCNFKHNCRTFSLWKSAAMTLTSCFAWHWPNKDFKGEPDTLGHVMRVSSSVWPKCSLSLSPLIDASLWRNPLWNQSWSSSTQPNWSRTSMQQLTCKLVRSLSFYSLLFSFGLSFNENSVKPLQSTKKVLEGGKISKRHWDSVQISGRVPNSVKSAETILPFCCCPSVFFDQTINQVELYENEMV